MVGGIGSGKRGDPEDLIVAAARRNDGTDSLDVRVGLNIYSNEIKGYLDPPILIGLSR